MFINERTDTIITHMDLVNGSKDINPVLSSLFNDLDNTAHPMVSILPFLFRCLPSEKDKLHSIAHYIDDWGGLAYHSSSHHAKVSLLAGIMSRYYDLSLEDTRILLLTSCVHDLEYSLSLGIGEMENYSIDRAVSLGFIDEQDKDKVKGLNRATIFPEFRRTGGYSANSIQTIISDCDLAPSACISFEHFLKETTKVEKENATSLSNTARTAFLNAIGNMESMSFTTFENNRQNILKEQTRLSRQFSLDI